MDNTKINVNYVNNFYNNDTVIYDFDNMLLGKWHSSFDSSVNGAKNFDNLIAKYINLDKGKNKVILDFGCGIGTSLFEYAEKYPQHNFIGLNVSPKQIDISTKILNKKKLKNVKFVLYDGINIPFKNNSFDVIYSFEAFCHVENKPLFIKKFYNILKKNGLLLITDWNLSNNGQKLYDIKNVNAMKIIDGVRKNLAIPNMYSLDVYQTLFEKEKFIITHLGYLDDIAKGHLDDNFSGKNGLYDYNEDVSFNKFWEFGKQIITDGIYRLKLFINFKNKINKNMKNQLDNGYFALNDATDNGLFRIGLIRAFA
jgi:ubiquinone/menaquinone biosynthesis C-methylase UbiE